MNNSIINYDSLTGKTSNTIYYSDYTSKKYKDILELDNLNDYLISYTLSENEKIEQVSYSLYGSLDYWDLILIINEMNPIQDMVFSFDIIVDKADLIVNNYIDNTYKGIIPEDYKVTLINLKREELLEINENNRTIKVPNPNTLNELMKLISSEDII